MRKIFKILLLIMVASLFFSCKEQRVAKLLDCTILDKKTYTVSTLSSPQHKLYIYDGSSAEWYKVSLDTYAKFSKGQKITSLTLIISK